MKRLTLLLTLLIIVLASCRTSQKFQAGTSEDKILFKAINELNKKPGNAKAEADLVAFYPQAKQFHEETIEGYRVSSDINRYDKMLTHLNAMQHIYNSIMATPGTASLLKPKSYLREIAAVKEEAAEEYYRQGQAYLGKENRKDMLRAYNAFRKSNEYVTNYKDVKTLIRDTYESSIVNVVINPIEDRNVFFTSWGGNDFSYRPDDYQQTLVNELGGTRSNQYPARFYTDRDARRQQVNPDWIVDIQWTSVDPLHSMPRTYNRNVSKNIQIGTDTANKPVYKEVHATIYVSERNYTVRGDMEYRIRDIVENASVDYGRLTEDVSWTERTATYRGDSRALSQQDWAMINNQQAYNRNPTRGEVLNTLMREIYPELRRRIQYAMN
jgi:hypothetical protein